MDKLSKMKKQKQIGVRKNNRFVNIYGLSDPRNPELIRYIGKAVCIKQRYNQHIKGSLDEDNQCNLHKKNWIKGLLMRGFEPVVTLIAIVRTEEWREKEKHYIKLFKSFGAKLLNLTDGGDGTSGYIYTEELRQKRREQTAGENNPFYDEHHTDATKEYMCEIWEKRLSDPTYIHPAKGRPFSEEAKLKQKQTELERYGGYHWLGRKHKEDTCQQISVSNSDRITITNGMFNRAIKTHEKIPNGWYEGINHDYRFVNNGEYNLLIPSEQKTPTNFINGKKKKKKTIVSEEAKNKYEVNGRKVDLSNLLIRI